MDKKIDSVSLARIERMIQRVKLDNPLVNNWEDYEVSFEFVCASLFPKCWDNVQSAMIDAYTKGYLQRKEEEDNENIRN